jgi:hypothetical protein
MRPDRWTWRWTCVGRQRNAEAPAGTTVAGLRNDSLGFVGTIPDAPSFSGDGC